MQIKWTVVVECDDEETFRTAVSQGRSAFYDALYSYDLDFEVVEDSVDSE